MDDPRKIALKALLKVEKDKAYSNIALDNALKGASLEKRDAGLCSAVFYGVIERKITLDYIISALSSVKLAKIDLEILCILRMGLFQMIYLDKIPVSAAVDQSVKLSKKVYNGRFSGFVNGVLRAYDRKKSEIKYPLENTPEYLHIKYSCPKEIIELWQKSYGREVMEELLKESLKEPPVTIRVNTAKISSLELLKIFEQKKIEANSHENMPNAFDVIGAGDILSLGEYKNGLFYLQDLASQICCECLAPSGEDIILDVCAAPGGKSFTIAQSLVKGGTVYSFDLYEERVKQIKEGAKRLGLLNIKASVRDAANGMSEIFADKILVDAPCSGLGVIRRKPEIKYKELDDSIAKIQLDILTNSAKYLKPDGLLLYSTCTLNPSENEDVINAFLKTHSDFSLFKIKIPAVKESFSTLTLFPHINKTDGFFIAVMKKTDL